MEIRARNTDPLTSHMAGAMAAVFIPHHEASILDCLLAIGNATSYEIAAWTGLTQVSVARRMKEIERDGAICRTDETRPSPLGRACTVWALVKAA